MGSDGICDMIILVLFVDLCVIFTITVRFGPNMTVSLHLESLNVITTSLSTTFSFLVLL